MSKRWLVLPVLALLALAAVRCGGASAPDAKSAPDKAATPAAKVTLMSTVDMSKAIGKVTFVELWGVWCPPCIRSMPHLEETYEKYKGNASFNLLVVNTGWRGDNVQKVQSWMAQNPKYTFPVFLDDRASEKQFATLHEVNSIPRSLIYDKKGKLRYNGHPMEIPATLLDDLLKE